MEKYHTQDIACMRECFDQSLQCDTENEVEQDESESLIGFSSKSERSELERYHD